MHTKLFLISEIVWVYPRHLFSRSGWMYGPAFSTLGQDRSPPVLCRALLQPQESHSSPRLLWTSGTLTDCLCKKHIERCHGIFCFATWLNSILFSVFSYLVGINSESVCHVYTDCSAPEWQFLQIATLTSLPSFEDSVACQGLPASSPVIVWFFNECLPLSC